jgi:hypothetical protein
MLSSSRLLTLTLLASSLTSAGLTAQDPGRRPEKVLFVEESVADQSGDVLRLLGGSRWQLHQPVLALPASRVIIVLMSFTIVA